MSKATSLVLGGVLLLAFGNPARERFAKYKAVEAYEIRPGILMIPSYSVDGQVCEIGLERRHYSLEKIRLDASMSREEVDQALGEIVPPAERGAKIKDSGGPLITQSGHSLITQIDFEKVSIQIFSEELSTSRHGSITEGDVVATVHWKNRTCQ